MPKISFLGNLLFVLLLIQTKAKNFTVDANFKGPPSSGPTFQTLNQAIQALYSGGFLIDVNNTITLAQTCVPVTQSFPNTLLNGTSNGTGSIAINFINTPQTVQTSQTCNQLPTLQTLGTSYLQVSRLTSLLIRGVNLIYNKANNYSALSNITNVTFSSLCFYNEQNSPLSAPDAFLVQNVTSFNMMNAVYFFDAFKMILITHSPQIILNQVAFFVYAWAGFSLIPAFNISNPNPYSSALSVSNLQIYPLTGPSNLPPVKTPPPNMPPPNMPPANTPPPNTPMPFVLWVANVTNVSILSFSVSDCNFNTPGNNSQFRSLISVYQSSLLSISNFQVIGMHADETLLLYQYYIQISAVQNVVLSGFLIQSNLFGSNDNQTCLVYISDTVPGANYPMQITVNQWQIISIQITSFVQVLVIDFNNLSNFGGFSLNDLLITGMGNNNFLGATFLNLKIGSIQNFQTSSINLPTKYITLQGVYVNQTYFSQSSFADIVYTGMTGLLYTPCVELIHFELSNFSFVNNTLAQAQVIEVQGILLAITQFTATNNIFSQESNFIRSVGDTPTTLISNAAINLLQLEDHSSFILLEYTQTRIPSLESCFKNGNNGVFSETAPFILYNSSFDSILISGSSLILQIANPIIIVQQSNFTNIVIDNSALCNLGGYEVFLMPDSTYLTPNSSQKLQTITNFNLSVFTAAESLIFANYSGLYNNVYLQTRNSLANLQPFNITVFVSIESCYFANISSTNSETLLGVTNTEIMANFSVQVNNNYFTNLSFTEDSDIVYMVSVPVSILINNTVSEVNSAGNLFYLSTTEMGGMTLIGNTMLQTTHTSLYEIDSTSCSDIAIAKNYVNNSLPQQTFITITCSSFQSAISLNDSIFENIIFQNNPDVMSPVDFISFTAEAPTDSYPPMQFTNNRFRNITLSNKASHIIGVLPISLLFLVSAESPVMFINNTFDLINITPSGNLMTISAQSILYAQSNFTQIMFESSISAVYGNAVSVQITDCSFIEFNCKTAECSGMLQFQSPFTNLSLNIQNSFFENNTSPFSTLLYITTLSIQVAIDSCVFLNNYVMVDEGFFTFLDLTNSSLVASNLNIIQNQILSPIPFSVFYLLQSGPGVFLNITNLTLLINGNTSGTLIETSSGAPVGLEISDLEFINTNQNPPMIDMIPNALLPIYSSIPTFGLLQTDNIDAKFERLNVQNISSNAAGLIIINCNDVEKQSELFWRLQILDSNLENLTLSQPIIILQSDYSFSGSLDNLAIILHNTTFLNVSSTTTAGAVILSKTALMGSGFPNNFSIEIDNCSFLNITGTSGLIYAGPESNYPSIMLINNSTFDTLTATGVGGVIYGSFNSTMTDSISISSDVGSSNSSALYLTSFISYQVNQSTFNNINSQSGSILYWESSTTAVSFFASESNFTNIHSIYDGGIILASYYPNVVSNSLGNTVLKITFLSNNMINIGAGQSGGVFYFNSSLTPIGNMNQRRFIASADSQIGLITIQNNNFTGITSNDSGGILFEHTLNNTFAIAITSNIFENVSAQARGGAFYFNQPNLSITNNSFTNCLANISGNILYSVSNQINITDFPIENLLISYTDQTQSSYISYSSTNLKLKIISLTDYTALLPEGSSPQASNPIFPNFTSLALQSYQLDLTLVYLQPGAGNQQLIIVTDETPPYASNITLNFISPLDQSVQTVFSNNCSNSACQIVPASITLQGNAGDVVVVNATYVSQAFTQFQQFSLRLRACVAGEINSTATKGCQYCANRTYSLDPTDSKCQDCPAGAACYGGANVTISQGYYRSTSSPDTLLLVPCNDSDVPRCPENNLSSNNYSCIEPFSGPVCLQCNTTNGYFPAGTVDSCSLCYSKIKLIVYSIAVFLISIIYQIVVVVMTYKENKRIYQNYENANLAKQQINVASEIRPAMFIIILTTFFQLSTIVANYNTGTLISIFEVTNNAASPNTHVAFLLQCGLIPNITTDPLQGLKFQILFYIFSPIVKILLVVIVEVFLNVFVRKTHHQQQHKQRRRKNSLIRVGAVAVVLILLEQPGIIGILFKYLKCIQLDPYIEETYITGFSNISCSTDSYSLFLRVVVIPALVFWALLVPFFIFAILFKNRKTLHDSEYIRVILGSVLNSYRNDAYYWGVLIVAVKSLIYTSNALINSSYEVKIMVYLLILNIYSSILIYKMPFIDTSLNNADRYCYLSCTTMMMLVLLQSAITDSNLQLICSILATICFVWAAGNVLRYVFWLQIKLIYNVFQDFKHKRKEKQVLMQTLELIKAYHNENPPLRDQHHRRKAIRLDLSMRLRNTIEFELDVQKAKDEEERKTRGPPKLSFYRRIVHHLTSFTQLPSLQQFDSTKRTPEPSIGIEIFSYSNQKIEDVIREEDAIREEEDEHQDIVSLKRPVSIDLGLRDNNESNTSYRSNRRLSRDHNISQDFILSPVGLREMKFSMENIDEPAPYITDAEIQNNKQ